MNIFSFFKKFVFRRPILSCVIVLILLGSVLIPLCCLPGKPDQPRIQETVIHLGGSKDPLRRGDIVFIHGLGGGARSTWEGSDSTFFWPEELGKKFPDVGVWAVAYDASPSAWFGGSMPLLERSKNILDQLRLMKIGDRPTIFVGHSLGGLVIKQLLRDAFTKHNNAWEEIGDNTKGVIFLATPHTGSDLPGLVNFIHKLVPLTRQSVNLRELDANSEQSASVLLDLNSWYRNDIPDREIKTTVLYEKNPTFGQLVVTPASADPGLNKVDPIAIEADHLTICKLRGTDDLVYKHVADFIDQYLTPVRPYWAISFPDFIAQFNIARNEDKLLQDLRTVHVGQKVKWKAIVRTVMADDKSPGLAIAPSSTTPVPDWVTANFAPRHFKKEIVAGSEIVIEGVIKKTTNKLGAFLHECKIVQEP